MTQHETSAVEKSVLDPIDRLSEILFGLIMVLSATCSLSIAAANRFEVTAMLIGALGCNLAWGLIDAIMFLMARLHSHGADLRTIKAIKGAASPRDAYGLIREGIPRPVAEELDSATLERIRRRIETTVDEPARPRLRSHDLRAAFAVFGIVVASTFPVLLPFLAIHDVMTAMRVSNAIAVTMLAVIGFAYGSVSGLSPWRTAFVMVVIGTALVALTIVLGG
jgi:hypothetical protein